MMEPVCINKQVRSHYGTGGILSEADVYNSFWSRLAERFL